MTGRGGVAAAVCLFVLACASETGPVDPRLAPKSAAGRTSVGGVRSTHLGPGIDVAGKEIAIGALNDESDTGGPWGRSVAMGVRLLVQVVNGGGVLPDGWRVRLVEADHKGDVRRAGIWYEEIAPQVLFFATVFSDDVARALLPRLARDQVLAFPASEISEWTKNAHTPALVASYRDEAMRALDHVLDRSGNKTRVAVIAQREGFGSDAVDGWQVAARARDFSFLLTRQVRSGLLPVRDLVAEMSAANVQYVMLAVAPSATEALLLEAHRVGASWHWIGVSPSWTDEFFSADSRVPPAALARYRWVSSLPYWGEDVPGMSRFLHAWDRHGDLSDQADFQAFRTFAVGMVQMTALAQTLISSRPSRSKFAQAIRELHGGHPLLLTGIRGRESRVLAPDPIRRSWIVVDDLAVPRTSSTRLDARGGNGW